MGGLLGLPAAGALNRHYPRAGLYASTAANAVDDLDRHDVGVAAVGESVGTPGITQRREL